MSDQEEDDQQQEEEEEQEDHEVVQGGEEDEDDEQPRKKGKTGVVYLPQIPNLMSPGECRLLLVNMGFKIGRVYFRRETKKMEEERRKRGGNTKIRRYIEGWVEFEHKSQAKACAEGLNSTPVGGRSNRYATDMWMMRYLSGFKWEHLTADAIHRRALHDHRLQKELQAAKDETQQYLDTVDRAHKIEHAVRKKRELGLEVIEPVERPVKQKHAKHNVKGEEKPSRKLLKKLMANEEGGNDDDDDDDNEQEEVEGSGEDVV